MTKHFLISVLVGLSFSFSALAASETVEGAKKDYAEFKKEMSEKLDNVEKKLSELKDKAKEKGAAAQEKSIDEIEKTKQKLKTQLNDLESSSESTWSKVKKSFAHSVDQLNTRIQKAAGGSNANHVLIDPQDQSCTQDSDCAVVKTRCTCGCAEGVNKKNVDKYTKQTEEVCKNTTQEMVCRIKCPTTVKCQNLHCTL